MSTLLHIDSIPLYGRSVSRKLSTGFVTQWKAAHPHGKVIDRDLDATAMPPINADWVGASTRGTGRTRSRRNCSRSPTLCSAQLERANAYVIGVPMHNFGVPSFSGSGLTRLRAWAGLLLQ